MKTPPVLRRPGKLILCALLLAATAGAALLFALQAQLDGLTLAHSMDAYAYVGAVTYGKSAVEEAAPSGPSATAAALAAVDGELLSAIENSPYVTSFDTRTVRAGLLEDIFTVPDRMITTARLKQHHFLEASVIARNFGKRGAYESRSQRIRRSCPPCAMTGTPFVWSSSGAATSACRAPCS